MLLIALSNSLQHSSLAYCGDIWGRQHNRVLFRAIYSKKFSEWQNGGVNKGVAYLFDLFDYSSFQFVRIITSECSK
jgi:hypothetical protein